MGRIGGIVAASCVASLLAGCTHNRPLTSVNEIGGENVVVETTHGESIDVYAAPVPNGVVLRPAEGGFVPAHTVVRVVQIRRGRGAFEGFAATGGVGLVLGALIGYGSGDDHCTDFCILTFTAGEKAMILGTTMGLAGGLVGLIVGAALGSHFVYSNENRQTARIKALGPPGSAAGFTVAF
jgi:hypothetical protein